MTKPVSLFASRAPFAPSPRRYEPAPAGAGAWGVYDSTTGAAVYMTRGETASTKPADRARRMAEELNEG